MILDLEKTGGASIREGASIQINTVFDVHILKANASMSNVAARKVAGR